MNGSIEPVTFVSSIVREPATHQALLHDTSIRLSVHPPVQILLHPIGRPTPELMDQPKVLRQPGACESAVPAASFPERCTCGIFEPMKVAIWLHRLLPILAVVGLVLGPITAPVNSAAMAAAAPMSEMMDDMPCCPPEQPFVPDCPMACPLMAVCLAKCFPTAPTLSALNLMQPNIKDAPAPGSAAFHDSLAAEPPARPPRT